MVVNRPVVGVSNPAGWTFPDSFSRAKNAGPSLPESNVRYVRPNPGKHIINLQPQVSLVGLLEAAASILNEKKY